MKAFILFILFLFPAFVFAQCQKTAGSNGPYFQNGHSFTYGDTISWDFYFLNRPCWSNQDSVFIWIWPEGVPAHVVTRDTVYRACILPLFDLPSNSFGGNHKDFKVKMNFNIPTGNYTIQFNYESANQIHFTNTVSSINNPVVARPNEEIFYYNIYGQEIINPTEGVYIWRSSLGRSGKVLISH